MIVINLTSKTIVAFGWNAEGGHGDDMLIKSGNSGHVNGPLPISGSIVCQETETGSENSYQLPEDRIISVSDRQNQKVGVTVQYYSEER